MRIVGGRHRGRPLTAPAGDALRPTADRVREAIFNILHHGWDDPVADTVVLDAFAGTGALGLEALSRGAAHTTFIDDDPAALACIRRNAARLGETARVALLAFDATRPPPPPRAARAPTGLVFLDPPYGSGLAGPALVALAGRGWIADGAPCVVEIAAREPFAPPPGFVICDERAYGGTGVLFLVRRDAGS